MYLYMLALHVTVWMKSFGLFPGGCCACWPRRPFIIFFSFSFFRDRRPFILVWYRMVYPFHYTASLQPSSMQRLCRVLLALRCNLLSRSGMLKVRTWILCSCSHGIWIISQGTQEIFGIRMLVSVGKRARDWGRCIVTCKNTLFQRKKERKLFQRKKEKK